MFSPPLPIVDHGGGTETPPLIFIPPRLGSTTSPVPSSPRLYPSQHTWRKYGQLDSRWSPREGNRGTGWQGELSRYPRLLVLGEVGTGKTALLRYLQLHGMPGEGGGLPVRSCLYLSLGREGMPPPVESLAGWPEKRHLRRRSKICWNQGLPKYS